MLSVRSDPVVPSRFLRLGIRAKETENLCAEIQNLLCQNCDSSGDDHSDCDSKLEAVDRVLANAEVNCTDLAKVVDELEDLNIDCPDNSEVLWRLGEAYYKISEQSKGLDDRKKYIRRGVKTCQRAVKLKPKLPAAHKWLAMLLKAEKKENTEGNNESPVDIHNDSNDDTNLKFPKYNTERFNKVLANIDAQFENNCNRGELFNTVLFLENCNRYDYPENPEVLWRIAKANYYVCLCMSVSNAKTETINKGVKACEKAVKLNSELADAHKWLVILIGLRAEEEHINIKFNDVILLKKHVNIALQLNPNDSYLYYMLGRYDYWLASLTLFDRAAVGLTFRDIPEPSYKDALVNLLKAEDMADERFKANELMIGKCYLALKKYKIGIECLLRAKALPSRSFTESIVHNNINTEILSLLSKYKNFIQNLK